MYQTKNYKGRNQDISEHCWRCGAVIVFINGFPCNVDSTEHKGCQSNIKKFKRKPGQTIDQLLAELDSNVRITK